MKITYDYSTEGAKRHLEKTKSIPIDWEKEEARLQARLDARSETRKTQGSERNTTT